MTDAPSPGRDAPLRAVDLEARCRRLKAALARQAAALAEERRTHRQSAAEMAAQQANLQTFMDASAESVLLLQESHRRLETLLANLPGMAYRCRNDPDWTAEFVSEGCLALTGYQAIELLGNARIAFADVIHPDDREPVWNGVQKGLTEQCPYRLSYRILRADGEVRWVWEQGRGVFQPDGQLVALEGFIFDISERVRAQEALDRSRALWDAAAAIARMGGWEIDLASNTLSWSEQIYRIHEVEPDYQPSVATGIAFYAPESQPRIREAVQRAITDGAPYDLELTLITAKGHRRQVNTVGQAQRGADGRVARVAGTLQDITERKRQEADLARQAAELARINEDLERLAYVVSHDLQEPLRMITSYTQLLERRFADRLDGVG
ncbi:MAG TPA: PAS domain-containing protein, partial [Lamprocystis sp. (in: g-proteobacteria)]|nr:PAS domain-containing protein [Lamprocystis sp. (in: g-proteobacteria)]